MIIRHIPFSGQAAEQPAGIPGKKRQVFTWSHFDELSIREIAAKTGTAGQTVRNQLNSAYRKARRLMKTMLTILGYQLQ
jgi:DNA-directed RNA polymerase specialized sigma24 family protein